MNEHGASATTARTSLRSSDGPGSTPPVPADLYASPNALAPHYSRFRVAERLLLTGHSHQAWPDRGFEGQKQAWLDAAELVDEKWERAFAKAERVRWGYARLLGLAAGAMAPGAAGRTSVAEPTSGAEPARNAGAAGGADQIALAESTHTLVIRFLSSLPLRERPRLLTTDGEFHSLRRQLDRLAEEGAEVAKVPAYPASSVGERLAAEVDDRTSAVFVSSVFYLTAHIAGGLDEAQRACQRVGAELLVDAYHSLNVVPFSLSGLGLDDAFVVGGGYKYCELGGGNGFLRIPPGRDLRPVITGWFAEPASISEAALRKAAGDRGGAPRDHDGHPGGHRESAARVRYAEGPDRFAGATYDPTSHYRAAEVFDFFEEMGLDPGFLREVSRQQVGLLAAGVDGLDADPKLLDRDRNVPPERVAGFLSLRSPRAGELSRRLRTRGVHTDFRGETLRLGPAPYLSDRQLEDAVGALGEAVGELQSPR